MDGHGILLSLVVTGANRHDVTQVDPVLDAIVGKRPETGPDHPSRNLCADKGYVGSPAREAMESRGYVPPVVPRGQERENKKKVPGYKARRWVVEVAHAGSTGSGSFWSGTRNTKGYTGHSFIWPQRSSRSGKPVLFTDRFLILCPRARDICSLKTQGCKQAWAASTTSLQGVG